MNRSGLLTAGQRVVLGPRAGVRLRHSIRAAAGESLAELTGGCELMLEQLPEEPSLECFEPVTRGVWAGPDGVLIKSVGGSGYTQLWQPCADPENGGASACVRVSSAWAPSAVERAAAALLRQRRRALEAQVLLHHPALWSALSVGGLTPLHVSVLEVEGTAVLLAGPGGVGKSSLVAEAMAAGARATCDNLGVSDGRTVHGLVEPLRLPADVGGPGTDSSRAGARAAHGRREHRWSGRVASLRPELVVVVRREDHAPTRLRPVRPERAARALVAGTYAAGELLRFWPLVAQLALAGIGPVHPSLEQTAARLTESLPCYELTLGVRRPAPARGPRLAHLLRHELPVAAPPTRTVPETTTRPALRLAAPVEEATS